MFVALNDGGFWIEQAPAFKRKDENNFLVLVNDIEYEITEEQYLEIVDRLEEMKMLFVDFTESEKE